MYISVSMTLSTVFHSINSPDNLPLSHSVLPVLILPCLVVSQSLNVLPLKPGVGQYIAMHATLTARDYSLLVSNLPIDLPACFPKPLPSVFVLAVANTGSCLGPQNKIGHPAGCGFPC